MPNDKSWQTLLTLLFLLVLCVAVAPTANEDQEKKEQTGAVQDERSNNVARDVLISFGETTFYIAASLILVSIRYLLLGTYKLLSFILNPAVWLLHWLWITFIVQPFQLALHVARVLYPVAMFCLAAVVCGTVIGGCAGFAAEAISAFAISATWGKPIVTAGKTSKKSYYYDVHDVDDGQSQQESIVTSEASSVDDSMFFGADATASGSRDAFRNVDSWRESILSRRSSSSSSSFHHVPGARAMNMSAMQAKEDNWNWPEEEEEEEEEQATDEYPRQRRPNQKSALGGGL